MLDGVYVRYIVKYLESLAETKIGVLGQTLYDTFDKISSAEALPFKALYCSRRFRCLNHPASAKWCGLIVLKMNMEKTLHVCNINMIIFNGLRHSF